MGPVSINLPGDGVVSDGEDDEEGVHGGERDEEHVERVAHPRLQKDDDTVANGVNLRL